MMAVMGSWGLRHTLPSTELAIRALILEEGGPPLWSEFMEELRHLHLGTPAPKESVLARLQAAYEAAVADAAEDRISRRSAASDRQLRAS